MQLFLLLFPQDPEPTTSNLVFPSNEILPSRATNGRKARESQVLELKSPSDYGAHPFPTAQVGKLRP